jgi:hypothetical protein
MDVETSDALENAVAPEVYREIRAELGISLAEFLQAPQPLLSGQGGERSMAGHERSLKNLERFRDVDAFDWFPLRAQCYIGEIAIVGQPLVRCLLKGMNDGHRGFLSQRLET